MRSPRIQIDRETNGWRWTLLELSWKGNWNAVQSHPTRFGYVCAVAQAWLARRRWS